jgi:3-hydroxymyristoyl/3-hydroxydecanoyl-(acyl carrier protein) dehydratase
VTLLGTVTIIDGHPAVPGHFPGDPIIPGVLLLAEIFALLCAAHPGLKVERLLHVKFLRPGRPDETMAVTSREKPGGRVEFDGMVSDACALRGAVRMAPA